MAMVVQANRIDPALGGHISSFASAATLYDVGFNHFFHAPTEDHGGNNDLAAAVHVADRIRELTEGGAHVSIDALGHRNTAFASMSCLRKRGRHVQVGLMTEDHGNTHLPWGRLIGHELEVVGSHGMQAHEYEGMLRAVRGGLVDPGSLVSRTVDLEEGVNLLMGMDRYDLVGVAVIDRF